MWAHTLGAWDGLEAGNGASPGTLYYGDLLARRQFDALL